jgi:hypothetical protein
VQYRWLKEKQTLGPVDCSLLHACARAAHSWDACTQMVEEKATKVGFLRLLSMTRREWPYLLGGCIASVRVAAVMPLLGFSLSSLIAAMQPATSRSRIIYWFTFTWCLRAINFICSGVQVPSCPSPHACKCYLSSNLKEDQSCQAGAV